MPFIHKTGDLSTEGAIQAGLGVLGLYTQARAARCALRKCPNSKLAACAALGICLPYTDPHCADDGMHSTPNRLPELSKAVDQVLGRRSANGKRTGRTLGHSSAGELRDEGASGAAHPVHLSTTELGLELRGAGCPHSQEGSSIALVLTGRRPSCRLHTAVAAALFAVVGVQQRLQQLAVCRPHLVGPLLH